MSAPFKRRAAGGLVSARSANLGSGPTMLFGRTSFLPEDRMHLDLDNKWLLNADTLFIHEKGSWLLPVTLLSLN